MKPRKRPQRVRRATAARVTGLAPRLNTEGTCLRLLVGFVIAALAFVFIARLLWRLPRNVGHLHGGGIDRARELGATAAGHWFSAAAPVGSFGFSRRQPTQAEPTSATKWRNAAAAAGQRAQNQPRPPEELYSLNDVSPNQELVEQQAHPDRCEAALPSRRTQP